MIEEFGETGNRRIRAFPKNIAKGNANSPIQDKNCIYYYFYFLILLPLKYILQSIFSLIKFLNIFC